MYQGMIKIFMLFLYENRKKLPGQFFFLMFEVYKTVSTVSTLAFC